MLCNDMLQKQNHNTSHSIQQLCGITLSHFNSRNTLTHKHEYCCMFPMSCIPEIITHV